MKSSFYIQYNFFLKNESDLVNKNSLKLDEHNMILYLFTSFVCVFTEIFCCCEMYFILYCRWRISSKDWWNMRPTVKFSSSSGSLNKSWPPCWVSQQEEPHPMALVVVVTTDPPTSFLASMRRMEMLWISSLFLIPKRFRPVWKIPLVTYGPEIPVGQTVWAV